VTKPIDFGFKRSGFRVRIRVGAGAGIGDRDGVMIIEGYVLLFTVQSLG